MGYPFLIYSLVSLIVGLALVLTWRRHREQGFLRALGYATLLQGLAPAAYLWWHAASGMAAGAAALLQAFTIVGHVLLLLVGAAGLAGRRVERRTLIGVGVLLTLVHLGFIASCVAAGGFAAVSWGGASIRSGVLAGLAGLAIASALVWMIRAALIPLVKQEF